MIERLPGSDERMLRTAEVVETWRHAQLAEVSLRRGSSVDTAVVVPLVNDGLPCVALSYDRLALARSLASADEVVLAVTTFADTGHACTVRARAEAVDDPKGTAFLGLGLLEQELAKHPPSRRRIDSLLLRREHWWLVPRLIVRFRQLSDGRQLTPADGIVAFAANQLDVAACSIVDRAADELRLRVHEAPAQATPAPAVVLEHGADVPDLERPWYRRWRGRLAGAHLTVEDFDEHAAADRPLRLLERWSQERVFERACRKGLREAGIH